MFRFRQARTARDVPATDDRSEFFRGRKDNRYWWHSRVGAEYCPPVYGFLDVTEWKLLTQWFDKTDKKYGPGTGECAVPAISLLQGLIMGNGLRRIIQCGHFIGYSAILKRFHGR